MTAEIRQLVEQLAEAVQASGFTGKMSVTFNIHQGRVKVVLAVERVLT